MTDIALEEAACASPLRAMGGGFEGCSGGRMGKRKPQRMRVMGRMKERRRRRSGGVEGKKLLSGCENAAQPKRLSLE